MVINSLGTRIDTFWEYGLDNIIIEQQPAGGKNMFSSVRMKVVSHALHAYFYSQQLRMPRDVPVTFVSPSSKLVGLEFNEWAGIERRWAPDTGPTNVTRWR